MQFFTTTLALLASAAVANAGTVTFWTLDDVERTVYFTPSPGSAEIAPVVCNHKENKTVDFGDQYIGNFYAVANGAENKPGMLGEVTFSGFQSLTFFDVSAIVDPADHTNVKQMWPVGDSSIVSGCEVFPCNNAYWRSDDVQTKVTHNTDLMTTLGSGSTGIDFVKSS